MIVKSNRGNPRGKTGKNPRKKNPPPRSVKVADGVIEQLRTHKKQYNSMTQFSIAVGIGRENLIRVLLVKSASLETVQKIHSYLNIYYEPGSDSKEN